MNDLGANVPQPNFDEVERQIYAITDMIDAGLLLSCHDISDGGLAVTLAEMCFGGDGENRIGVNVDITHCHSGANEVSDRISQDPIPYRPSGSRVQGDSVTLPSWKKLFSETGGFVFETKHAATVKEICSKYNLQPIELGKTSTAPTFIITDEGKEIINETVEMLADRWLNGLREELE